MRIAGAKPSPTAMTGIEKLPQQKHEQNEHEVGRKMEKRSERCRTAKTETGLFIGALKREPDTMIGKLR